MFALSMYFLSGSEALIRSLFDSILYWSLRSLYIDISRLGTIKSLVSEAVKFD